MSAGPLAYNLVKVSLAQVTHCQELMMSVGSNDN